MVDKKFVISVIYEFCHTLYNSVLYKFEYINFIDKKFLLSLGNIQ